MDHRRDFEWLVLERYGAEQAKKVDWSAPRLVCIAGDFTKFDVHAVNQMNRNIELVRYRRFNQDLLLFELLTSTSEKPAPTVAGQSSPAPAPLSQVSKNKPKTVTQYLSDADQNLLDLYDLLKQFLIALGDDVQVKTLDQYVAFRRLKNFACVEVKPQIRHLKVFLKVNPDTIVLEPGFTRDVRNIGHFGTGDLEVIITGVESFEKAKALIERSYENA